MPGLPESIVLESMLARLDHRQPSRVRDQGLRLLGISGFAALPLYLYGLLGAGQAAGILLLGWLSLSSAGMFPSRVQGVPRSILPRVLLYGMDLLILLSVGWSWSVLKGDTGACMLFAAGAGLSSYLAYYSAVSLLKAVPSKVRLGNPGRIVALDHLFLSRVSFWGGEREIVICLAAFGLLAGMPLAGFIAAAIAGNLNWIYKSARFWREVKHAEPR